MWMTYLLATGVDPHPLCDANFFFHQLLSGVDVAIPSHASTPSQRRVFNLAKQMQNYMYLVGDAQARECVAVDAVYDPAGVVAAAEKLGCNVTAAIATHFHYDHIGHNGQSFGGPGMPLPGLRHFIELGLPVYIHASELAVAAQQISAQAEQLSPLGDGDEVSVGSVRLRVVHTPGHSPGSILLIATADDGQQRLALSGDTVFPGSCGRLDLPGSSVDAMYSSLQTKVAALDDELPLFPGHAYGGPSSTIGREKASGFLRPSITLGSWRKMMAR